MPTNQKTKKKGVVKKKTAPKKPAPKKVLKPVNNRARAELQRLRNLQRNQYGAPGDDKDLIRYANLVGTGKRKPGSQDWKVKAGKATNSRTALRAGRTVQAELNPQISAAKNYEAGLQRMYDQLAQTQAGFATNIRNTNTTARQNAATGYDQLASQISKEFQQSRQASNDELARLGINMADAAQTSDVEARLASLASSGKQNALSAMDMQSSGFDQLMALLQGQSAATGAGYRTASSQQRAQLESSRPGKVYSLWQQLEDQRRQEAREAEQTKFLNRITQAKFGVESDYQQSQALANLAKARKDIVDSKRPSTKKVTKTRIR